VRSNTSIELKVVRAVFGVENNRTQAYTRVLQLAKKDLPEGWKLAEWIEEKGGVEEVRRTPKDGPTLAEQAEKNRIHAEEVLANIDATVPRFKPIKSLQPEEGGDYQFSVALVRVDNDGKAAIVFGMPRTSTRSSVFGVLCTNGSPTIGTMQRSTNAQRPFSTSSARPCQKNGPSSAIPSPTTSASYHSRNTK
jgi:hypothetical protein